MKRKKKKVSVPYLAQDFAGESDGYKTPSLGLVVEDVGVEKLALNFGGMTSVHGQLP